MKTKNRVKEIFVAAGYTNYCKDNKDRSHRALAKLLETGLIEFNVIEKGKVWVTKNGFKYNIKVVVPALNHVWRRYDPQGKNTSGLSAYNVLMLVGSVLKSDKVKDLIPSYVNIDSTCQRCGGHGFIRQFAYYCDGICFECYGTGRSPKFRPVVEITGKPDFTGEVMENDKGIDYTKIHKTKPS